MKKELYFIVLALALFGIIYFIPVISSAHYIVGYVNDSFDGENANGYVITIWNPLNGISDNITDIIGPSGNSGSDNIFFVDCEMLGSPCNIGDEIRAKVLKVGQRVTSIKNLTITGAGFDLMSENIINSIPNVTLLYPANFANISRPLMNLNCSVLDLDSNLANVSLYGNWSGNFISNETLNVSGGNSLINFTLNLSEGKYIWNCLVTDDLDISRFFFQNYSFTLDRTPPNISNVAANYSSSACLTSLITRVNCTVQDSLSLIQSIHIEANNPINGSNNYSMQILSGNTYYADILIDQIGTWSFSCHASDHAGNIANRSASELISINPPQADLIINVTSIDFDSTYIIENQPVIINASIINQGCSPASNFLVGFYENDPSLPSSVQINGNKTISVSNLSSTTINVTWLATIGPKNIFVLADVANQIAEHNETNNKGNNTVNVNAWQTFYGNSSVDKLLSKQDYSNLTVWGNETLLSGNIYFVDSESNVNWKSLQAIGKNISNSTMTNDFYDIDSVLNMTNFSDSISNTFTLNGTSPKILANFTIYQRIINDVPMINSTNNTNFKTGILWDTSDDVGNDGEYDFMDKEDLIFFSPINNDKLGKYGNYDYEISIPVRLREVNDSDLSSVYIYFELN